MNEPTQPAAAPAAPVAATTVSGVFRRLGPAGPLALVAMFLPGLGGFVLLGSLNVLAPWLRAHQEVGVAIYITAFSLLAGFALLPTYAQSVLGGWAFGFAVGYPAALAGFLGAASLGYAVGRCATGDRVLQLLRAHPKWHAVYTALVGSGFWRTLLIVTLVRLNSPFSLTNYVMAATRVHPVAYVLGTLLGLGPRTAAAVFIAVGLQEVTSESPYQRWLWIATMAATLVAVLVIGQIATRAVQRVTGAESPPK